MPSNKRQLLHEIAVFSLPAIAEKMLMIVIGLMGTLFVGRLGTAELAAVSVSNSVLNTLMAFYFGIGLGATILIARAMDEKDGAEQVRQLTFQALTILFLFAVVLSALCFAGAGWVLDTLFGGLSAQTRTLAIRYLRMCLPVSCALALDIAVSSCLRGVKDSRLPFLFTALVNTLNIALCLLFIYGFKWGIDGAAWAYIISTLSGCVAKLAVIVSGRGRITLRRFYPLRAARVLQMLHLSVPALIEQVFVQFAFIGVQVVTAMIGDVTLAGYQVSNNILSLLYAVTGGLEMTTVTLTGNALGRGEPDLAKDYARTILLIGEAVTCACAVVLFIFAGPIVSLFTRDPAVIEKARSILRIMCFTVPLTSCFQCITGTLKTSGMLMFVVTVYMIGPWLLRIPVAYLTVRYLHMDIYGLIVGFFCDYTFRAGALLIAFLSGKWLKHRLK